MGNKAPARHAAGPSLFSGRFVSRGRADGGFTTLELVIVIALAVVVAAIATSAYETYTVRREVDSALTRTLTLRSAVERAYRHRGEVLRSIDALAGKPPRPANLRAGLEVTDGRIDVRFGAEASEPLRGRRISLTPYESALGEVVWICGNAIAGVGLNPLGFAAGGPQSVQITATVEPRFLPSQCR